MDASKSRRRLVLRLGGLELGLQVMGVVSGDEVIVPAVSTTLGAILRVGGIRGCGHLAF